MFTTEPLWVDLSGLRATRRPTREERERARLELLNGCATIAAPLRSMDKDELYGAHIVQLRRARQRLSGGLVLLSLLLVVAVVAGLIARDQATAAREQARIATARALASASAANLDDRLDLAQLLAVEAYRMDPGPAARAALLRAVTAQPRLVRYLPAGAQVTRVAGARDGSAVLAGTAQGVVTRWTGTDRRRGVLGRFDSAVTGLATNADGSVVAASAASRATVWTGSASAQDIPVPAGQRAASVAVSPSGRRVLLYSASADGNAASLTALDRRTGRTTRVTTASGVAAAVLPSDAEAVVLSLDGTWQRRDVPGFAVRARGSIPIGNRNYGVALAADGKRFTFTYGGERLGIWPTVPGVQDIDRARWEAGGAGPRPAALALSSDGSRAATVANGVIHVSAVGERGADLPPTTELGGNERAAQDTLAFVDSGDRLLSAAGSMVAEWDLDRVGLIGSEHDVPVPTTCNACVENPVAISPDGTWAAVPGSAGAGIWLYPLTGRDRSGPAVKGRRVAEGIADDLPLEPVAWEPSGERLYFMRRGTGLVESHEVTTGATVPHFRVPGQGKAVLLSVSADARRLLVVSQTAVTVSDLATGRTLSRVGLSDRARKALTDVSATWLAKDLAVHPSWRRATVVTGEARVLSVDLRTGGSVLLPDGDAQRVSYESGRLVVGRADGSIDVFGPLGTRVDRTVPQGRQAAGNFFSLSRTGSLLAQYRDDGSVMLTDPGDAQQIGLLQVARLDTAAKASLQFTPDGKRLVVFLELGPADVETESPGVLQQWDVTPGSWSAAACRAAGRNLSPDEWRRHVGPRVPGDLRCARP
jgi:hypothetical protein